MDIILEFHLQCNLCLEIMFLLNFRTFKSELWQKYLWQKYINVWKKFYGRNHVDTIYTLAMIDFVVIHNIETTTCNLCLEIMLLLNFRTFKSELWQKYIKGGWATQYDPTSHE
ncbi:hypothetical protein ACJX0J_004929, partial [Zea mays]